MMQPYARTAHSKMPENVLRVVFYLFEAQFIYRARNRNLHFKQLFCQWAEGIKGYHPFKGTWPKHKQTFLPTAIDNSLIKILFQNFFLSVFAKGHLINLDTDPLVNIYL